MEMEIEMEMVPTLRPTVALSHKWRRLIEVEFTYIFQENNYATKLSSKYCKSISLRFPCVNFIISRLLSIYS